MNLGVEEQAQRRKKDKRRSRKGKRDNVKKEPIPTQHHKKLFQTKTMQIQQRKIGLIIGQNGKNIKKLYQLTHCDILLPRPRKKKEEEPTFDANWNDEQFYYVYDAYNDTEHSNVKLSKHAKQSSNDDHKGKADEEEEDLDDPRRLIEIRLRGSPEEI